jgi:hypothetical protein
MNEQNRSVEEIMNSLDGVKRAQASDYFYTRLKGRMEKGTAPQPWLLRPVYAFAVLILVVIVNVGVILKNQNKSAAEPEAYQSIAAEYHLNDIVTEEVYK